MKYSVVIGDVDQGLVGRSEKVLTSVFLDLGIKPDNRLVGSQLGGDPFVYTLMHPIKHVCTMNIPTAGTDGKVFYWNPKWVLKQDQIGLRIVCGHEAWHAVYMHPRRVGKRDPKLWNICIDYVVNWNVLDDLVKRGKDAAGLFKEHLGNFHTISDFEEMLKDPMKAMQSLKAAGYSVKNNNNVNLPHPGNNVPLTDEQKKSIETSLQAKYYFYADPNVPEDLRRPEVLYEYFLKLLPKCPECGRIGMYKKPSTGNQNGDDNKNDQSGGKEKGDQDGDQEGEGSSGSGENDSDQCGDGSGQCDHNHDGDGQQSGQGSGGQPGCNHGGCGTCGGDEYIDVLGFGDTLDAHMPSEEEQGKLTKRISDAMETASKLAGSIPASLEDEIGRLTAPKISWKDVVRGRQLKAKRGNTRNDWTSFKSRPMFAGVLAPKKISYASRFGVLLDTSGSMSQEDISFGVSQLQSLDRDDEGVVVPADAQIYWKNATILKNTDAETLKSIKVVGRGGTMFGEFFSQYEKNVGSCDFLIVITDGWLMETDIANMKNPGVDVVWLITSESGFRAPFGRVYNLRNV